MEQLLDGEPVRIGSDAAQRHLRECPGCAMHAVVLLAVRAALRRRAASEA